MNITLDYGQTGLPLDISGLDAQVISPVFLEGIVNEKGAFAKAADQPFARESLRNLVNAKDTIAVVIPDITRALPNERLLSWLFETLAHVPAKNFTIISGTGTHRGNTEKEWFYMVGESIFKKYRFFSTKNMSRRTVGFSWGLSSLTSWLDFPVAIKLFFREWRESTPS
jgi:lactate racemase